PGDLPAVQATPRDIASANAAAAAHNAGTPAAQAGRMFASPRARMRARAIGVDLTTLHGSGPHGRIVEADVLGASTAGSRVLATPLARRLAQEHGVSIADLRGTGPGGRITQDDVLRVAEQRAPAPAVAIEAVGAVQPLSRIRRITAERMAASALTTAWVPLAL